MKDRLDFNLLSALLKKQRREGLASFRKGNFNAVGFIFRVLLTLALVAVFVVFFGNFLEIYLGVMSGGATDPQERLYEVLSVAYAVVLLAMIVGGVAQINGALFGDDIKIMSALPVGANTLFASKLITIYLRQAVFACVCVLAINLTAAAHLAQGAEYYAVTVLSCLLLPLLSVGIASVLALPLHAFKQLLKDRFVLTFIVIIAVTAALLALYAWVLGGVKALLFGDDLRYFFSQRVMDGIAAFAAAAYPANLVAGLLTGRNVLVCALVMAAVLIVCAALSAVFIRLILGRALRNENSGSTTSFRVRRRRLRPAHTQLFALVKKEFLTIFRTPDYAFSYFAVALVVPLMVYFCISIGSSLAVRLIAVDCDFELAVFLTLLFGSLSNVFCTTNISRDGRMFYSVKAMPIAPGTVIFSKVLLCLFVTVLSQLLSAALLAATGYVSVPCALFLLAAGVLFGFAQICVATRVDFDHARFSSEPDGEIKESGNTVSTIMVAGLALSFIVGGAVVLARMYAALRGLAAQYAWVTFVVAGAVAVIAAAGGFALLACGLKKRYYRFSGGII